MRKLTFSDKYVIPNLTLLSGLSISAVAVWYSVAGLVAIFAASATAIIIMGVVLEVGKLVTAVYLHRYWQMTTRWLKTYLSIAVIFLMFITSMGIFGFLSKAHIPLSAKGGLRRWGHNPPLCAQRGQMRGLCWWAARHLQPNSGCGI